MPLLMSAFTPKANIGPQLLHVRSGSKADMCSAQGDVRYLPKADIRLGLLGLTLNQANHLHGC